MTAVAFAVCIVLLLTGLASSACMDGNGKPLMSTFRFPAFEDSALQVQVTYNTTILDAAKSLSEILSLDAPFSIQSFANAPDGISPVTFDNTLGALSELLFELWLPGYRLYLLSQTSEDEEIRDTATQSVVNMEKWGRDNIDFNLDLYKLIAAYADTDEAAKLTGEPRRLLTETLADYQRRGMMLGDDDRAQLTEWEDRLSELTTAISGNINGDEGAIEFTTAELEGLSEQQLASLKYNANTSTYTALTAISSQYSTVAGYATASETRRETIRVRTQRAMTTNGELILEVVQLRQKVASLLGFQHWADYRTSNKMAQTGATAKSFIENLDQRLNNRFFQEKERLLNLKKEHLGASQVENIHREDIGYYINILMEREYQINQEEISEYFEEEATLKGIFQIYEELFNISISIDPNGGPTGAWSDDVKFVRIYEAGDHSSPNWRCVPRPPPPPGQVQAFCQVHSSQGASDC